MSDETSTQNDDFGEVTGAFKNVLDRHGYSFQYAVLNKARELADSHKSFWHFEASEFPVEVQAAPTHIDFLLKKGCTNLVLVCECKRANPALANWCFAKIPYLRRKVESPSVIVERVENRGYEDGLVTTPAVWTDVQNVYNLGLEVKTRAKGDDRSSGRGALQDAVTQSFRGINGLVQLLNRHQHLVTQSNPWFLISVIFTTASLWISDVKLERADLNSGDLSARPALTRVPWLVYNYNVSPGLRHSAVRGSSSDDLSALLHDEFTRSTIIVAAEGIDEFLVWSSNA